MHLLLALRYGEAFVKGVAPRPRSNIPPRLAETYVGVQEANFACTGTGITTETTSYFIMTYSVWYLYNPHNTHFGEVKQ
jgi:hypothetical protein